ncbi:hypothetical protein BJY04DRAFT_222649 [Aspergillus karnatakaensis]|uniref:uncharacterized protein n=1 Tax=Aspergillus karnatakaensis TaxID=1810916 RepID=UPI003CCD3C2D
MKLNLALATAVLALTPAAAAWRVRFYPEAGYGGQQFTKSGPGNPGTSPCMGVSSAINDRISSLHWYPKNPAGDRSCCLYLYANSGCTNQLPFHTACQQTSIRNMAGTPLQDKISSFKTVCTIL